MERQERKEDVEATGWLERRGCGGGVDGKRDDEGER